MNYFVSIAPPLRPASDVVSLLLVFDGWYYLKAVH